MHDKKLSKLQVEGNFLKLIKSIFKITTANRYLLVKYLKPFMIKNRTRVPTILSSI